MEFDGDGRVGVMYLVVCRRRVYVRAYVRCLPMLMARVCDDGRTQRVRSYHAATLACSYLHQAVC